MNKLPWFKFYPADWIKGTRELSAVEKGVWIDLLAYMWESKERGNITSTWDGIARLTGIPWLEAEAVVRGLGAKNVLEVTEANGKVTLISRRMENEENARISNKIRQRKFKSRESNAKVTREKSEVRSQKSDNRLKTTAPIGAAALTPQADFVERFKQTYQAKTGQPYKADRKDFIISAELIRAHGLDACVKKALILGVLCESRSAWFTRDGWASYTVGKLSSQWNSIIQESIQMSAEQELQEELKKQEAMRERVDNLIKRG